MTRFLSLLLLALLLPAVASAEVPFIQRDLKAALARAKAEKRPLMVDVFATWCGPCKELDAKVFATPEATATPKPSATPETTATP